jgi:hypothetical protein
LPSVFTEIVFDGGESKTPLTGHFIW